MPQTDGDYGEVTRFVRVKAFGPMFGPSAESFVKLFSVSLNSDCS